MSDNVCSTCFKKFLSPSHLKRHNNSKNGCKPPDIDVMTIEHTYDSSESFMSTFKKIIKNKNLMTIDTIKLALALLQDECQSRQEDDEVDNKIFKCFDCNEEFAYRQGLYKHNKYNRCKAKKGGYSLDDILHDTPSEDTILVNNGNPQVSINDVDNSNVNVDASINNNIITNHNYHFNIQPFGLETLEHITLKDFKLIFSDANRLMANLCNYVFLQNQSNMSFYKHNLNKQIISFLSKNMEIEKIDEKGFIYQFTRLLEDTCILLFYQHREELSEAELIKYMKRLVEYQDTILCERNGVLQTDTKNCILNLMDTAFRNKEIKYNIEKIIKDLKEKYKAEKNDIVERLIDEDYKRDDIINEFYDKKTSTTHKMQMGKTPQTKVLHKIRAKAREQNTAESVARRKKATEDAFKDVKFRTSEEES